MTFVSAGCGSVTGVASGERRRRRLRRAARPTPPAEPTEPTGTTGTAGTAEPTGTTEPTAWEAAAAKAAPAVGVAEPTVHPGPGPAPARRAGAAAAAPQSPASGHRPSPADLAELSGAFALTAGVHDPEPDYQHDHRYDDATTERGLRGLVGGGSSQVSVTAAMRARDSSRPTDQHVASAETDLLIVRRGWVPREELPRPTRH
jgi:hypothetical protein